MAYNAERTVARTIESILAQTFGDFSYHVVDNGSRDGTRAVINEFAARDNRIIARANAENHVWEPGNHWYELIDGCDAGSYFSMLDADDEYKPAFLEDTLRFVQENQLDIAVCGSDFISSANEEFLSARSLEQDLILEGEAFGTQFPNYHQFMRTYWGKLYSISTLRNWGADVPSLIYGGDTLSVQVAFRRARRVGVLAGSLHKYYINAQSTSYGFDANRLNSDRILFDAAKDFLVAKVGSVSPGNEHFLYSVYLNAIRDTLQVLLTAKIPDADKIEHARYLKGEMDEIQRYFSTLPPQQSSVASAK
jgi:glycosyltransferase involved in cell wall biosynthesis